MDNTINCDECKFRLYHLSDNNVLKECLYIEQLDGSWNSNITVKDFIGEAIIPAWCPRRGPSRYIDNPFFRCQGIMDG